MDFALSRTQQKLRDDIAAFAAAELNTDLAERDRQQQFNAEGWHRCAEQGLQGLAAPARFGGREADPVSIAAALEGLGKGCRDNGLWFAINAHLWGCVKPLTTFGTDQQRERLLPLLCSGAWIGALAMSEREAGSDAYSLKTTARRDGDGYILDGHKIFISNGPLANLTVVLASVDPAQGPKGISAFLVESGCDGASAGASVEKMGLRTVPMGELHLENCRVPEQNRLGQEGAGLSVFTHAMEWERGFILAGALGAMQRLLEQCRTYARSRRQFGKAIGSFQLVAGKIVDMHLRLEAARLQQYRFAWLKTLNKTALLEASMTKLCSSEAWVQSCQDALQIHGGYGYLTETGIERDLRDALASRLYSGTSEVQRVLIAQWLGLG